MRRTAIALLLALLPAACASADPPETVKVAESQPVGPGTSLLGNYLAGRHAQAERDGALAVEFFQAALKMDPDNPDLLRRTVVLMVGESRVAEAAALARRLVDLDGNALVANLVVVVDDFRQGRFAAAEKRLAGLTEGGVSRFMTPLLRSWALIGLGQPDAALEALASLSKNNGFSALHDLHAALINEMAGRTEAAEEMYRRAAASEAGGSLRVVDLFGAFYERTGAPDKAKALYDKYLADNPNSQFLGAAYERIEAGAVPAPDIDSAADGVAQALFDVAGSLRQQNARETALVFGRLALSLKPDFPVAQVLVGDLLEADGRLESANAVYASINPASSFAWSGRLRIALNLNEMGRSEEALTLLRAMAAERPTRAEPLITLGNILRGQKRFDEAVEAYDQAAERIGTLEDRHWSFLYARGMALERAGRWQRAEADFLKALEFEPEQPYVLNYLGYSWVEQGLHLNRARRMIERAVELRPNDGFIVDSLGWVLYQLDDVKGAVRELERAVELRPEDPVINDHLGDAYWKAGRRQEARFQWRRSLDLNPEPDDVATIEAKLEHGLVEAEKADSDG